jgi:hypothetical protein
MVTDKNNGINREGNDRSPNIKEINLGGMMRAKVVKVDDPQLDGRVGCIRPRIMAKFDHGVEEASATVDRADSSKFATASQAVVGGDVPGVNYVWLRPATFVFGGPKEETVGGSFRVPRPGTWVFCFFEDDDPQKGYYFPFGPTNKGERVSNENNESPHIADPTKKPNVDVLREYPDGTIIYTDFNDDQHTVVVRYRSGHALRIADNEKECGFEFVSTRGNYVKVDDLTDDVTVYANNDVQAEAGNDVKIKAGNDVAVQAGNDVKVDAGNNIAFNCGANLAGRAGGDVAVECGGSAGLTAGGNVQVECAGSLLARAGGETTVEAVGKVSLKSAVLVEIVAPAIKLN